MSNYQAARSALTGADRLRDIAQNERQGPRPSDIARTSTVTEMMMEMEYQRALVLAVLALVDELSAVTGQVADGLFIRK